MERSHSPDTTGTAGSPDKKADSLPSAMDSPDLAPAVKAAQEMAPAGADTPVFVPVVPEMSPEKADSLLLELDMSVLVLVPDILEEGNKAHS